MIYCRLKGGLGNVLFQIAAAIEFSTALGVECSFPNLGPHLSYLKKEKIHNPNLKDVGHYISLFQNLNTTVPTERIPIIKFPFHYEEKALPKECTIDGYFQSEKYFPNSRDKIIDLVGLGDEKINKVAAHVRRGDYLKNSKYHAVLSLEYYHKAFEVFPDKEILIFSDDIEWCREEFSGERFSFVDKGNDLQQMIMMSKCEHNIIANSSFSWWGAWLNKSANKKVIAPKKWFGPLADLDTKDIYCDTWEII